MFFLELPPNLFLLWEGLNELVGNNRIRKGFRLIWHAVVWSIWRARNERIFNNSNCGVEEILEAMKVLSWRWTLSRLKISACLFYEWSWNPKGCLMRQGSGFTCAASTNFEAAVCEFLCYQVLIGLVAFSCSCYGLIVSCFFVLFSAFCGTEVFVGFLLYQCLCIPVFRREFFCCASCTHSS